jgi:TP901-1 family phage major tail protein
MPAFKQIGGRLKFSIAGPFSLHFQEEKMPSSAIKGKTLTMSIEGDAIGESRDFTIRFAIAQIDVSSRDSDDWGDYLTGRKEWSIDFTGLYIYNDISQKVFLNHVTEGSPSDIDVVITFPSPDSKTLTGVAILTSYEISAPYEDAVTISGTLQGRGALEASTS